MKKCNTPTPTVNKLYNFCDDGKISFTKLGKSYWNGTGANQSSFEDMTNKLMPLRGSANSLLGEAVRAANRLYYEYMNNGNCNAVDERYYDEDECDYEMNDFYVNFINIIIHTFEKYLNGENLEHAIGVMKRIGDIILSQEEIFCEVNEVNVNTYDMMIDYVHYIVINNMNNDTEIPSWYKNT